MDLLKDIRSFIAPLIKWWWLIVVAAALATGASYWAVRGEPIRYQTTATLLMGQPFNDLNPDGGQLWLAQQLAQTYAVFAQREPVRQAVMERLGLTWLPEYYALVPPQTQFIEISVIDTDPVRAQLVANELAAQLIKLSPGGEEQESQNRQLFITQQLDDLQRQIEETKGEIELNQAELGELFSAREIADAQEQINALQSKLNSLQLNYATLLSNSEQQATNALTFLEPAVVPVNPIGPNKFVTIAMAAVLGAVVATGAAYLLEFLDDTIRSPDELERLTELPLLTAISRFKEEDYGGSNLVVIEQPRSPVAEALRDLRTGIQFSNMDNPNRTILVTSPTSGDGKSFVSSNLALILTQAGYKTLLIDADLRRPKQHKNFKLENKSGLTNLLLDIKVVDESSEIPPYKIEDYTEMIVGNDELYILTSGSIPPNPSELLGSVKMRMLLNQLPNYFDYIVIDSPPTLAITDPVVLAAQADGVLLVVSANRTRRFQLKRAEKRLREVQANFIGVVLNRLSKKNSSYYYDYTYGEEVTPVSKRRRAAVDKSTPENGHGLSGARPE